MKIFDFLFRKKNNKNKYKGKNTKAEFKIYDIEEFDRVREAERKSYYQPDENEVDTTNELLVKSENTEPEKNTASRKRATKSSSDTQEKKPQPTVKKAVSSNKTASQSGVKSAQKNSGIKAEKTPAKSINNKSAAIKKEEPITASKPARCGKFEIKKAKDGRFVFNLYASNNVIVATSQTYSSSTSAMNGIKSVIANAERAEIEDQTLKNYTTLPYPKWEIYLDKGSQYRFRLNATNGSTVCHSQGYTSKANCKNGIESIRKFAHDAEIDKSYLEKK